jgi:hypothetical protein
MYYCSCIISCTCISKYYYVTIGHVHALASSTTVTIGGRYQAWVYDSQKSVAKASMQIYIFYPLA